MAHLKLTLQIDDDPNDVLTVFVEAAAEGFAGHGRDWIQRGELLKFAAGLAQLPVTHPAIYASGNVQISVSAHDPHGHLRVMCELKNDRTTLPQHVALSFVSDHASIDRFMTQLRAALAGKVDTELVLSGDY